MIVAVGARDRAVGIVDAAARLARDADSPPEVVHVRRTAVVEEQAVDTESDEQARADSTRRWPPPAEPWHAGWPSRRSLSRPAAERGLTRRWWLTGRRAAPSPGVQVALRSSTGTPSRPATVVRAVPSGSATRVTACRSPRVGSRLTISTGLPASAA